jgi:hypothetical protein
MIEITLDAIPNQSLTIQLDNNFYEISIKETNGAMAATIFRNDVVIISGARIVAGIPLLPYPYQEDGNFLLLTANDDIPYYTQFGITQTLIYASQSELEAIRATTT